MSVPFAEIVTTPEWQVEATDWIRYRVAQAGDSVVGEISQTRVRPWSTQLVVTTDRGTLWFKGNCPALTFEPGVHAALARLDPAQVDEPYAVDRSNGWILTRDRGSTLADSHEPTLADWKAVVTTAAGLQRQLADHTSDLLGEGLPDCSPHTVPDRFDAMVDHLTTFSDDHPSHLSADQADRLRARRNLVEEAVATLCDGPMRTTFQHGDLHPGNVFAVDGALRIFDFGDAQWAHPLEMLAVPFGWITKLTSLSWPDIFHAYASVWTDVLSPRVMAALLPSALVTHAVNRSFTWWGAVAAATPEEIQEWGDSPKYYLELVGDSAQTS